MLCQSINTLERQKDQRTEKACVSDTNLSSKTKNRTVDWVEEKYLMKCLANDSLVVMLLDIGAQVSILSISFLKDNFPDLTPQPLNGIMDNADSSWAQCGYIVTIPLFIG